MVRIAIFALAASGVFGQATVPFVGCKSDGQVGPLDAPRGKNVALPISLGAAQRLTHYKAERTPAVLGPRGWNCSGSYGSGGSSVQLTQPDQAFAEPAIQLTLRYGDTIGRFDVAQAIARVFPAHKSFVDKVVREQILPASAFAFGPYPHEKLTYRSPEVAEFETPPYTEGLGTFWNLKKNDQPIRGVAILTGDTPDLLLLSVRLPAALRDLGDTIIQQVERDAQKRVN